MMDEERIDPGHGAVRGVLRVAGPALLLAGGICVVIALADFIRAVGSFGSFGDPPKLFWLFFVGAPLLFAGSVMTMAGFMGRIARYQAGEAAPVAKDTIHYMADETQGDVQTMARAFGSGLSEGLGGAAAGEVRVRCHKCNFMETGDAKFCSACGAAMGKRQACPGCGELNDPDARFCDACGKPL